MTGVHPKYAALVASAALLVSALLPQARAVAAGPVWLSTVLVNRPSFPDATYNSLRPAIATYRDTYILTTHAQLNPRSNTPVDQTGVYLTTGVPGSTPGSLTWTTRKLAVPGPNYLTDPHGNVALAVDSTTNRLFAVWRYTQAKKDTVGVWTSTDGGATWRGPATLAATSGAFPGSIPSVVAGNGNAYVAFTGSPPDVPTGSCDNSHGYPDIIVARYDGAGWSAGQNLTSCLPRATHPLFAYAVLARDEGGHLYLIATDSSNELWYADNAGGAWTRPARIARDIGSSPSGSGDPDYALAASKGTVYVAYIGKPRPGDGTAPGYDDVFLLSHAPGSGWPAPLDVSRGAGAHCQKYAPALVARGGRIGLAYIAGNSPTLDCARNTLYMETGTPASLTRVRTTLGSDMNCDHPALSSDGDLFRLAADCGRVPGKTDTALYYQGEFLDVVGPTMTGLHVPATALATSVHLSWSAQDPTPGSGVAYYEVRVKEGGGAWRDVVPGGTRSTNLEYMGVRAGHTYTFQVRARDRVDNWGGWVSASTRAS